ncbi:protein phosphatase CheZ [Acetobacteraceae bacterium KSS8]|uniref:Protein phosphatase CheZ n=1 Tax=Endosaccharibacter trunci TaxID=2812733 RepID=A0ABT1W9X0_9PROT|nr:protein phosphatase CheZ [Acetobacteraceae bacterium KSS8]
MINAADAPPNTDTKIMILATRFEAKIAERKAAWNDPASAAIGEIVMSILSTMSGDMGAREAALLHEINALGVAVANAREEIAALRVDDIMVSHIPCATDELDAIVAHTAAATESILEVCETLDELGSRLKSQAGLDLQTATSRIYEACSFQDITGQRISKVVATLKTIESTVARINGTFGDPKYAIEEVSSPMSESAALLNGPQLPGAAMDQADIDKLLASFD